MACGWSRWISSLLILSILSEHTSLDLTQPGANDASMFSQHCSLASDHRSKLGMVDAEMERLQVLFCRNLSLIVPLYGLD